MIITEETKPTPAEPSIVKARRAAARKAQEQRAEWLRARGWTCTPPADEIASARGR